MPDGSPSTPWFSPSLSFSCTQCGNCCSGAPGFVWATAEEVRRIAEFLHRPEGWLGAQHVRREGFAYSLTEHPDGDCIFLERLPAGKVRCRIYPVRPTQCRTWPFWKENLTDLRAWQWATRRCPGCGNKKDKGTFYPAKKIHFLMTSPSPQNPVDLWLEEETQMKDNEPPPAFLTDMSNLYRLLDAEIKARAPVCVNRGLCCHFEKAGHRLYVTAAEWAFFLSSVQNEKNIIRRPMAATAPCPFQQDGKCTVRTCRPIGCRIYFCDSASQEWQQNLYERYHARLIEIKKKYNLVYQYSEWLSLLSQ